MRKKGIWALAIFLLSTSLKGFAADIVPGEAADTSTGEFSESVAEEDETGGELYQISFPANIHACLDPGNLSGKGQIFSDRYTIENCGNIDVAIKITNIRVSCLSEEETYEFSEEKVTDSSSGIKRLNIRMVWGNEAERTETVLQVSEGVRDERVLSLAAVQSDEKGERAGLSGGSRGYFYFTGTMNANPDIVWEDGEITVHFDYEIVALEEREENREEEAQETSESAAVEESEEGREMPESTEETAKSRADLEEEGRTDAAQTPESRAETAASKEEEKETNEASRDGNLSEEENGGDESKDSSEAPETPAKEEIPEATKTPSLLQEKGT